MTRRVTRRHMQTPAVASVCTILGALLVLLTGCSRSETSAPGVAATSAANCSFEAATPSADGITRLALLVGVGAYKDASIRRLTGPSADVAKMHALLAGSGGYGFPENNVCQLVDSQATGSNFREAFKKALVGRAAQGAVLVIYFAGHGTQIPDDNDDEPDRFDEALMLVDARQTPEGLLRDDELNDLLESARKASGNIVMIMDACTSGSATRASDARLIERFQRPRPEDAQLSNPAAGAPTNGDQSASWVPQSRPGLVVMAAAVDGTPAIESDGAGLFTSALVSVLSEINAAPLTYSQLKGRLPPLLAASSEQVPAFEGGEDKIVFGAANRDRPAALLVRSVGATVKLGGTLMPGLGSGAELRAYDGGVSGVDLKDPAKSKAILIVTSVSGPNAEARIASTASNAPPLRAGDLAVMLSSTVLRTPCPSSR